MLHVNNVCHTYDEHNCRYVLNDVSISIKKGEFVILLGQSGSGKTTLLNIIAGLLKPTKGEVMFENQSLYSMTQTQLCEYRNKKIGFVFQNYFLENCFSAYENVLVPMLINRKYDDAVAKEKVMKALDIVGLKDKSNRKPIELSGGECQRVSVARALINDPEIIIADEPTGNLDSVNGYKIIELLKSMTTEGKSVLMVTHNENYRVFADRVYRILDGVIVS